MVSLNKHSILGRQHILTISIVTQLYIVYHSFKRWQSGIVLAASLSQLSSPSPRTFFQARSKINLEFCLWQHYSTDITPNHNDTPPLSHFPLLSNQHRTHLWMSRDCRDGTCNICCTYIPSYITSMYHHGILPSIGNHRTADLNLCMSSQLSQCWSIIDTYSSMQSKPGHSAIHCACINVEIA